jgi:septum formation protein
MFILASSSPRRQELLKQLIPNFKIVIPDIDERFIVARDSILPQEIARTKAYNVHHLYPLDFVFACDTMVYFKGHSLGKPVDAADARRMLKLLSGQTHKVISGYTLIGPTFEGNRTVVTRVTFNQLSNEFINEYIEKGLPFGKAGSYGIQDNDFAIVKKIEGSYSNVMGLPLEDLKRTLKKLAIIF